MRRTKRKGQLSKGRFQMATGDPSLVNQSFSVDASVQGIASDVLRPVDHCYSGMRGTGKPQGVGSIVKLLIRPRPV